MSINVHMKKIKRWNELEIRKLMMIRIRDVPADTVAQTVERRRDKPWAWVRILVSVRFLL